MISNLHEEGLLSHSILINNFFQLNYFLFSSLAVYVLDSHLRQLLLYRFAKLFCLLCEELRLNMSLLQPSFTLKLDLQLKVFLFKKALVIFSQRGYCVLLLCCHNGYRVLTHLNQGHFLDSFLDL